MATDELNLVPFDKLCSDADILAALRSMGFEKSTVVQGLTIPKAIQGKDLVVQASTGSGKTLSFSIPMLERLQSSSVKKESTFGIVVSPTRELAVQIADVIAGLVKGINPTLLIGGMPYGKQKSNLKEDARIVVGTPGRILDFIEKEFLTLQDCGFFVLDEADEMFSMGFFEDVERLIREIPEKAQGLFVSATISPRVTMLAKRYLKNPENIEAKEHEEEPPDIEHFFCNVGSEVSDKPTAIANLIEVEQPNSAIIFCNTRSETELIEVFLRRRGFNARRLNSDLNQKQRNKIMDLIRSGELRFLIATDIAARGIDIAQIELVINSSVPEAHENYVHRTGRTGRAGRSGKAISLVGSLDFMNFAAVKKNIDIDFKEWPMPTEQEIASARVKHLRNELKKNSKSLSGIDLAVAKIWLEDSSNSEESLNLIADLTRFVTEHLVDKEAKSLDDELKESDSPQSSDSNNRKSSHNRGGRNRGSDSRGGKRRGNDRRNR